MNKQLFYILLIIIGIADLVFCISMSNRFHEMAYPSLMFIFLRVFVATLLFFLAKSQMKDSRFGQSFIGFLLVTVYFVYSLFGMIAFIFVMEIYQARKSKKAKLYHIDQEEGEIGDENPDDIEAVPIGELARVAPLIDGLTDDDKDNRIAAIQAMEHLIDHPSIREALIAAKNDAHKEVQYYVNDALKKLTDDYMGKIKNQLEIINNNDPSYESYKTLADLYAYIAIAAIDHPVLVKFYHQESAKYYTYVLENYPEYKLEILKKLIPALYHNKTYDKCLNACEDVKDFPELSSLALLYKMRSLFNLRKIEALKRLTSSVNLNEIVSEDNLFNLSQTSNG